MRVPKTIAVFACALLLSTAVSAQDSAIKRDPQATAILQKSSSGMGGSTLLSQDNGVIARGTLTAATGGISGAVVWKNTGNEFRYERPGSNGPIVFVSGHGNPAIVDGDKVQGILGHLAMVTFPLHLPGFVLAAQLNNARVRVDAPQWFTVEGIKAVKVSVTDETDMLSATICKQDWYLDATTLLPFRVDYLSAEVGNALNIAKMTASFSDYHAVSGVLIPFHIVVFFNGQQIFEVVLISVELNVPIPTSDFDAPTMAPGGVQ